jgi:aminoglycoside phosphotransferase (APT) family kinase protein
VKWLVAPLDPSALAAATGRHLGGTWEIEGLRRMSGGASRETWSFDARSADGAHEALVLRRDPAPTTLGTGPGRDGEFRLLQIAAGGGVPVPAVRFLLEEGDGLGAGFVMDRVEGETIARKILRDDEYRAARPQMAAQCGEILARIHAVDTATLPPLSGPAAGDNPTIAQLDQYRMVLDTFGEPHPAFELGLRWLADRVPLVERVALVHGDFRNGNFIVGPDGIRAVLDWEIAHLGDPMEDLGWLCVKAWRFGVSDHPVGGFGHYEELFDAYERAGGGKVDPETVRFWVTFGTLKWGVMCIMQAFTHLNGVVRSVELAAIGRRVCENEHDLLQMID